jgi:hypothetical protein
MRLRALLGNGEMSSFQFARYKARKEESGNTLTEVSPKSSHLNPEPRILNPEEAVKNPED